MRISAGDDVEKWVWWVRPRGRAICVARVARSVARAATGKGRACHRLCRERRPVRTALAARVLPVVGGLRTRVFLAIEGADNKWV